MQPVQNCNEYRLLRIQPSIGIQARRDHVRYLGRPKAYALVAHAATHEHIVKVKNVYWRLCSDKEHRNYHTAIQEIRRSIDLRLWII